MISDSVILFGFFLFCEIISSPASSSGHEIVVLLFTSLLVSWGYYYLANYMMLGTISSFLVTAATCMFCSIDAISILSLGSRLRAEGLVLVVTQFRYILKNYSMVPLYSLYVLSLVSSVTSTILANRFILKQLRTSLFYSELSRIADSRRAFFFVVLGMSVASYFSPQLPRRNIICRVSMEFVSRWNAPNRRPSFVSDELKFFEDEKVLLKKLAPRPHTSLFVVGLESVRASSLGVYNKEIPMELTPFLSSIVESGEAEVVENLMAAVPNTMKVLYGSLCGVPAHTGVSWLEFSKRSPYLGHCLPRLLREMGWSTHFFTGSSTGFHRRLGFEQCFDGGRIVAEAAEHGKPQPYQKSNYLGYDERIVLDPLEKWLSGIGKDVPAFAYVGTVSTHAPYTVANVSRAERISSVVRRASKSFHGSKTKSYAAYLTALHDTDDFLRDLVQVIDRSPHRKDAVIVILGDHGEGFGEHASNNFHGGPPFSETVHVPCFIVDRRKRKLSQRTAWPRLIREPSSTLSFRWTLLDLLGFDFVSGNLRSPPSLPLAHVIGHATNKKKLATLHSGSRARNLFEPCTAFSSSLLDENVAACAAGDLKFVTLTNPHRVAVFNTTSDPFELTEVLGVPGHDVQGALRAIRTFTKIASNRYREVATSNPLMYLGFKSSEAMGYENPNDPD